MGRLLLSLMVTLVVVHISECGIGRQNLTKWGDYGFEVDDVMWLRSAPVFFRVNNETATLANNTTLTVDQSTNTDCSGTDDFGSHVCFTLRLRATGDYFFDIYFKQYNSPAEFYIYELVYVNDTHGTQAPDCRPPLWPPVPGFETCYNYTIGAFPSFVVEQPTNGPKLGFMTFADKMFGDFSKKFGTWDSNTHKIADGMLSGPLAIFDESGNTLLLSTIDNFMTSSLWHEGSPGGRVNWGVMGGVNFVPAGYKVRTALIPDTGINKAFETLGIILAKRYQQDGKREQFRAADITISHLGYWTDNGAYYYYNPEDVDGQNATYERTLTDVKTYADIHSIPFKYLQIDSWWYYKGPNEGIQNWTYRPDVFPNGIRFLNQKTKWPIAAHNRYWSASNVYDKNNGGKYNFVKEYLLAVPDDQKFWNDLFSAAKQWGLILYEQDWLNIQTIGTTALQTDLTLGERWLQQMDAAAQSQNIAIQYCMALPRHALQSIKFPAVTQARVSEDYHLDADQWKIGVTSIFADALGLAPYKDTFWTTTDQPGNPRYPSVTEPYPALESLVSTLSTGPVGPGDKMNATNRDLLLRCCNPDGLILKPSHPAKAIDRQLIKAALSDADGPTGEVWTTYTRVPQQNQANFAFFGILLATNMTSDYTIYPNQTEFPSELTNSLVFPYNNVYNISQFDSNNPLHLKGCTTDDFCLYYFSNLNLMNGSSIAVMGEVNKWVPMSPQRVTRVVRGEVNMAVEVTGAPNEELEMTFLVGKSVQSYYCKLGANGVATFDTSIESCTDSVSTTQPHTTSSQNKGTRVHQTLNSANKIYAVFLSLVFIYGTS